MIIRRLKVQASPNEEGISGVKVQQTHTLTGLFGGAARFIAQFGRALPLPAATAAALAFRLLLALLLGLLLTLLLHVLLCAVLHRLLRVVLQLRLHVAAAPLQALGRQGLRQLR
jgi:hypothetical protein